MAKRNFEIVAGKQDRLDKYLSSQLGGISRSKVKNLINLGLIRVGAKKVDPSYKLVTGEVITGVIADTEPTKVEGEDIDLEVVYEDKDCLVINKPSGLVVHPGAGHESGTLVNALLHHLDREPSLDVRAGIVHRLDKDTSGLMVVAKNKFAEESLKKQFQQRTTHKVYLCLVEGKLEKDTGSVDKPIGRHPKNRQKFATIPSGKEAQTDYKVIKNYDHFSLLEIRPLTGRTHQIRVHMSSLGHPLVGDKIYGHKSNPLGLERQFLHASKLSFRQPSSGEELEFQAALPSDLKLVLAKLPT